MSRLTIALCIGCCCAPAPAQVEGKFGRAALLRDNYAAAAPNPVYTVMPVTVECFAKIASKDGFNVLIANEPKNSVTHWEIFTEPRTGHLTAFWPGFKPDHVRANVDVADDQWHYLAMTNDGASIALFVDGIQVAREKVEKIFRYPDVGPLTFGHIEGVQWAKTGITLDEVRISRVIRDVSPIPQAPFKPDPDTVALWHFDGDAKPPSGWPDASVTKNPVKTVPRTSSLPAMTASNPSSNRWAEMDHGPFFSSTLGVPGNKSNVTLKGISVRLGKDAPAGACFDIELLRVSAAWLDGFIKLHPGREGLAQHPDAAGKVIMETTVGPGWARGDSPNFADPRPDKLGPLPPELSRYSGLYLHDSRVIVAYTVGTTEILETFDVEQHAGERAFVRTIEIGPSRETLTARLIDVPDGRSAIVRTREGTAPSTAVVNKNEQDWWVKIAHVPPSLDIEAPEPHGVRLRVSAREETVRVKVAIWLGPSKDRVKFLELADALAPPADLRAMTRGGKPRWGQPLLTRGVLGQDDAPYAVDTLTAPEDNPFKSFLRFGGHDFFANGDMAVCSVSGDVWIVSNIDDNLQALKWKRFATGLHQPLGLRILRQHAGAERRELRDHSAAPDPAREHIYVLGRDQITRLHDLNADGEADFYENFNNGCKTTTNGHAYATNLESDPAGNFYFTKCADNTEFGGTVVKVSADGKYAEPLAVGLRNANGAGVSPAGLITCADNQGEWIPASRLDIVEPGEFLGYKPMAKNTKPTDMGKPLCFMPQNIDNSSGGQVWVTSEKWGPFKGDMLHTSYGGAALLHVMMENVDGQWQGGVTKFPLKFETGIMRGRFSPKDGQLYLSGLRGWQTVGHKTGAIHRVRYTNKPVHTPKSLSVHKNGVLLTFPSPLDKQSAADPANYAVMRWTYKWTGDYPSRHWSVENPKKQGYDTVEVKSAQISPDGRQVFLEIPEIAPVLQQQITINVKAADGTDVREDVYHTIHALGPAHAP